jgi:PPIC-type PPIASE domain
MSTAIQFGSRQLTIDLISQHLTTSSFLPQVLREMVIDEVLADCQIEIDRSELKTTCDRLAQAPMYQGFDRSQLVPIADRILKLQKIKQAGWGNKVHSYFLQRKDDLDGVVYSIMQVYEPEIAQELFFRVTSGESSFAELAFKYSQNDVARDGGKTGPLSIKDLDPGLAKYIAILENGKVSPIFTFNNLCTFIRLEYFIPAQFDEKTSAFLIDELFNQWIQQKIAHKISSLTPDVKLITPEFEDNLLIESLDRSPSLDSIAVADGKPFEIELSPKPPKANIHPPLVRTYLDPPPQKSQIARSISNLSRLVYWLLSLAPIGSIIWYHARKQSDKE